jgi:hypothetical protein
MMNKNANRLSCHVCDNIIGKGSLNVTVLNEKRMKQIGELDVGTTT